MKKYYLFLIILFALKCSIIAQKVEPSRTYNLIEKCYCTSFKQVGKLYNGTIVYACTKCGKETMANPNGVGGTIEDIIEQNKREAKLAELMKNPSQASNAEAAKMLGTIVPSTITKQQEEAIKKIQKSQNVSNQQKPTTTSKPQSKTTSKPSTTTKKQQTNLDIPSVNRSSSKVAVKQPKPTVEENLGKISDGIDAAIDMVKKIQTNANKSKSINSEKIEKNKRIAQELNSITTVEPGQPIEDHPFESLEEARSVAYEMMKLKMIDKRTIEYSTGIVKVFDPHFGDRYYIQRIIEGNNETVETVTVNDEAWYTQDSMTGELEVIRPKKVTIEKIHSHPERSVIEPSMGDYINVINTSNKVKENVSSVIFGFGDDGKVSNQALIFFYPDNTYSKLEYNGDWKATEKQYLGKMCDDVEKYLYFAGKTDIHGAPCPLEGDKTPFNNNNSASSAPKNLVFGK